MSGFAEQRTTAALPASSDTRYSATNRTRPSSASSGGPNDHSAHMLNSDVQQLACRNPAVSSR